MFDGQGALKVTSWPKNTYFCSLFFGVLPGLYGLAAEKYPWNLIRVMPAKGK
jgi:hypothetical protein